jgi:hypothetical protein
MKAAENLLRFSIVLGGWMKSTLIKQSYKVAKNKTQQKCRFLVQNQLHPVVREVVGEETKVLQFSYVFPQAELPKVETPAPACWWGALNKSAAESALLCAQSNAVPRHWRTQTKAFTVFICVSQSVMMKT